MMLHVIRVLQSVHRCIVTEVSPQNLNVVVIHFPPLPVPVIISVVRTRKIGFCTSGNIEYACVGRFRDSPVPV